MFVWRVCGLIKRFNVIVAGRVLVCTQGREWERVPCVALWKGLDRERERQ